MKSLTMNELFAFEEISIPKSSPTFFQQHLPTILICTVIIGGVIYIVSKHKREMDMLRLEISLMAIRPKRLKDNKE